MITAMMEIDENRLEGNAFVTFVGYSASLAK